MSSVPVDYRHSETGITALMAAAARGRMNDVERLLASGADPNLMARNQLSAVDLARRGNHMDVAELLEVQKYVLIGDVIIWLKDLLSYKSDSTQRVDFNVTPLSFVNFDAGEFLLTDSRWMTHRVRIRTKSCCRCIISRSTTTTSTIRWSCVCCKCCAAPLTTVRWTPLVIGSVVKSVTSMHARLARVVFRNIPG